MKLKCHSFSTQQRFVEGSFFALSIARHWEYETKLDTCGSHSLVVNTKPWLSVWWIRKHAVRVWHWLLMQSQIRAGCSEERLVKLKPKSRGVGKASSTEEGAAQGNASNDRCLARLGNSARHEAGSVDWTLSGCPYRPWEVFMTTGQGKSLRKIKDLERSLFVWSVPAGAVENRGQE